MLIISPAQEVNFVFYDSPILNFHDIPEWKVEMFS